jgi:hypothetical protein
MYVVWKGTYSNSASGSVLVDRTMSPDFVSVVLEGMGGCNKGGLRGEDGGASGGKLASLPKKICQCHKKPSRRFKPRISPRVHKHVSRDPRLPPDASSEALWSPCAWRSSGTTKVKRRRTSSNDPSRSGPWTECRRVRLFSVVQAGLPYPTWWLTAVMMDQEWLLCDPASRVPKKKR